VPCVVGPRSREVTGRQGTAARSPKRKAGSGDARGRPAGRRMYASSPGRTVAEAAFVQRDAHKAVEDPSPRVHNCIARYVRLPRAPCQRSRPPRRDGPHSHPGGAPPGRRFPGTGAALTPVLTRRRAPRPRPAGPFACCRAASGLLPQSPAAGQGLRRTINPAPFSCLANSRSHANRPLAFD
jgi:hypothetical protein